MKPSTWQTFLLGELLKEPPKNGYSPKEVAEYTGKLMLGLGCLSSQGFGPKQLKNAPAGDQDLERARLTDGDVLISRSNTRAAVGFAGIYRDVGSPCFYPDLMMRLLPSPCIESNFLVRQLQAPDGRRQIEALASGTSGSMVKLNRESVLRLRIAVPSLHEQRKIAEILDTLDDAIRKTEEIIAKLKQVKQGLLHDLLTRGIDDNGELRDPVRHPEQFKDSPLGRMPKAWGISRCEDLSWEITVGIVVRPTQYYREVGIPVLRSANVREGRVVLSDLKFMSEKDNRAMGKTAVSPGDLITVRTGYPGTTAVVPHSLSKANCVDIIISRPEPTIDPHFLATWINSDFGKGQVLRKQGGLAQQHFNVGEMKELLVAHPPLPEQMKIAKRLGVIAERAALEEEKSRKLQLLKQGLMEDLLTGRVRVTPLFDETAK